MQKLSYDSNTAGKKVFDSPAGTYYYVTSNRRHTIFGYFIRRKHMTSLHGMLHTFRQVFRCLLFFLAIVAFTSGICTADIFNASVNFDVVAPQGEFRDNLDRNGYGGSATAVVQPNPVVPIKFGLEIGFANYGSESRREPFSYTIPDVTVNVRRSNNIFLGHLLLRAQKEFGSVAPYVDGLFGLSYLWTDTTIEGVDEIEEIASSRNIDDAALSYGYGGGVMFKVWSAKDYKEYIPEMLSVYIDLKIRYLYGGEAEYLKKGAVSAGESGKVNYDISESRTDMMLYQIGVAVGF